MADNLKPGLGAFVSVSATLPASEALADYKALTYVKVGEVTEIPKYGASYSVVEHTPLDTGITQKFHGPKNNGSLPLPMALDPTDDGQAVIKAALASRSRITFDVTYADGTADYFQGKVFSFTRSASIGSVVQAEVLIEIETDIVEDLS
ncbi:MAG TPA: hypothetical protein ENN65_08425 [Candidatus Hydrogenedentes bacterium]|nr:hypothetical protein [Candidatus Hydrogenedentota bacterium]